MELLQTLGDAAKCVIRHLFTFDTHDFMFVEKLSDMLKAASCESLATRLGGCSGSGWWPTRHCMQPRRAYIAIRRPVSTPAHQLQLLGLIVHSPPLWCL